MDNLSRLEYIGKTSEDLVEESALGDDDAFEELVRRHMRSVFNFVTHYTSTEEAEDIVQDVFYKFWKNIRRFTQGRAFKPWLYSIARNTALDYLKKKRPLAFSELSKINAEGSFEESIVEMAADPEPLPSDIFEQKERALRIDEALAELPPDRRAVIILHYREGMNFEEIAVLLKTPVNTVKSWHRRSLPHLRRILEKPPKYNGAPNDQPQS